MRSGEKPTYSSPPATLTPSGLSSSAARNGPPVVPGATVDSRTTTAPGFN
jgi:hypothetical protein